MINRWCVFILLILLCCNNANGQTYWVPRNPLLDSLLTWDDAILQLRGCQGVCMLPISFKPKVGRITHILVKDKKNLYLLIDGTGQVYKATAQQPTKIAFTRIDSTYFSGYNFGAFDFAYHDTIFSFGGEGFWRINGQLRYFTEGADWNIDAINAEYPALWTRLCYLPKKSLIVYRVGTFKDLATSQLHNDPMFIQFDLATKTNTLLGRVSDKFLGAYHGTVDQDLFDDAMFAADIPALNGLLIVRGIDEAYFIRPLENAVFKLKPNLQKYFLQATGYGTMKAPVANVFAKGDTVYFTNDSSYRLHYFTLSMGDFTKMPFSLYSPIARPINYWQITAFMLVGAIAILAVVLYNKRAKRPTYIAGQVGNQQAVQGQPVWQPKDLQILAALATTIETNGFCTADDLNQQLGVKEKSDDVQKKVRSNFIATVNNAFAAVTGMQTELLERKKDGQDKRVFVYTITAENARLLKVIMHLAQ